MQQSEKFTVYNPYDQSKLGEYTYDSIEVVEQKIAKLRIGRSTQQQLGHQARHDILMKLAELVASHAPAMALQITRETGKVIDETKLEMQRAILTIKLCANECLQSRGQLLSTFEARAEEQKWGLVERAPLGIVMAITPFNFPVNLALHKILPAFVAGNCILYKPAPVNYQTAQTLVDLCYRAGMPENVLQFCVPSIEALDGHILSSPHIHCISFTGATKTADAIAKKAGRKKLLLELGGNDPLVLFADADVDRAVEAVVVQRYGTSGQRCIAPKRVYIQSEVYEEFKQKLLAKTKQVVVGNPETPGTIIGPLISEATAKYVEDLLKKSEQQGTKILMGGNRQGATLFPTVIENVASSSELFHEEIFAPVVPLYSFKDIDEVIYHINQSSFGLQAGIFTNDLQKLKKMFSNLHVGAVLHNQGPGKRYEHFPFGGVSDSGQGREGIRYAIEELSCLKTLVL